MIRLTKPVIDQKECEAAAETLKSGWLAEGQKTRQFERQIAEYVGADYAVAVCNATVGLELCLRALKIKGKVATPAFGHPATVRAILNAGCEPVFVDVELENYNVSFEKYSAAIKEKKLKAHMPVSWGGNPVWSVPYDDYPIIEDAACSLGAEVGGYRTGGLDCPELTVFSFHPRKLITTGEGGIITTNQKELADNIRELKNFGYGNYKFDDIRAAIGIEQLKKLPAIIMRRREMARIYGELLTLVGGVDFPVCASDTTHTLQTYAVLLKRGNRDKIIDLMREKGIEVQRGADYLADWRSYRLFLNSHKLSCNLLALPMQYDLTYTQQQTVTRELECCIQKAY